jgi:hypothetical protein
MCTRPYSTVLPPYTRGNGSPGDLANARSDACAERGLSTTHIIHSTYRVINPLFEVPSLQREVQLLNREIISTPSTTLYLSDP